MKPSSPPLSPKAREKLDAYRRVHALPPAVRDRVRQAIATRVSMDANGAHQPEGALSSGASPHFRAGPRRLLLRTAPWVGLAVGLSIWLLRGPPRPEHKTAPVRTAAALHALVSAAPAATGTPLVGATPAPSDRAEQPVVVRPAAPRARRLQTPRVVPARGVEAVAPVVEAPGAEKVLAAAPRGERVDETPSPVSFEPERSSQEAPAGRAHASVKVRFDPVRAISHAESNEGELSLDAEVLVLRRAYELLQSGSPLRALSALSEYARRFPAGVLRENHDVTRMLALCELGQIARAQAEAARFLAAHASSTFAPRVRTLCAETRALKID